MSNKPHLKLVKPDQSKEDDNRMLRQAIQNAKRNQARRGGTGFVKLHSKGGLERWKEKT